MHTRPQDTSPATDADGQAFTLDRRAAIALLYLSLPILIFLLGWFKLPVGLLMVTIAAIGLRHALASTWARTPGAQHMGGGLLLLIVVAATVWSSFGGAGHIFYANFDWLTRDAVLRDLVLADWPPSYGTEGSFEKILRAPIAYYLPAAALAKLVGVAWADSLLLLWTILGVSIFFSLLPLPSNLPKAALLLVIVVLFSGMDIVGWSALAGRLPEAGEHIEWWARAFQYSSNSTQLFWVPNHALPGWIAIALFFRHWRNPEFGRFAPMLFAMLPLWSPFAAVGMLPFYLLLATRVAWQKQFYSVANLLPAIGILALCARYLTLDLFSVPAQSTFSGGGVPIGFLIHYAFFLLVEFALLCLLLFGRSHRLLLAIAFVTLAVLPAFRMGPGNDIVMRGGIPALMLVCILVVAHFREEGWTTLRSLVILALLAIGAVTPFQEFHRALSQPSWPINLDANLVEVSGGRLPPHYVARLNQPGLMWLMNQPGRVPEKISGGQGQAQ